MLDGEIWRGVVLLVAEDALNKELDYSARMRKLDGACMNVIVCM